MMNADDLEEIFYKETDSIDDRNWIRLMSTNEVQLDGNFTIETLTTIIHALKKIQS